MKNSNRGGPGIRYFIVPYCASSKDVIDFSSDISMTALAPPPRGDGGGAPQVREGWGRQGRRVECERSELEKPGGFRGGFSPSRRRVSVRPSGDIFRAVERSGYSPPGGPGAVMTISVALKSRDLPGFGHVSVRQRYGLPRRRNGSQQYPDPGMR